MKKARHRWSRRLKSNLQPLQPLAPERQRHADEQATCATVGTHRLLAGLFLGGQDGGQVFPEILRRMQRGRQLVKKF